MTVRMRCNDLPLAVTYGEPAGIGPELVVKSWQILHRQSDITPFFVIADRQFVTHLERRSVIDTAHRAENAIYFPIPFRLINHPAEAKACFAKALPILPFDLYTTWPDPGCPSPDYAPRIIAALEYGVQLCHQDQAAALVTAPLAKHVLYQTGFSYPGQTEFLAACDRKHYPQNEAVMMLVNSFLRVVPLTTHIALHEVAQHISPESIIQTARITAQALRELFGIAKPRLAICGLNPHAGEEGKIGREEIEIIHPAICVLEQEGREKNWSVSGPYAADSLFHESARQSYDAVLCMYHDQALIPVKTLDFYHSVNMTLGLSFIRTSPDHGTAFDIAGQGVADPRSMIAALKMATQLARRRRQAL